MSERRLYTQGLAKANYTPAYYYKELHKTKLAKRLEIKATSRYLIRYSHYYYYCYYYYY